MMKEEKHLALGELDLYLYLASEQCEKRKQRVQILAILLGI